MENQHLTYFKVENFKKFDSLEVKDIGQFNLIVGDNNVGKTCFLESLLVDFDNSILTNNWLNILRKRNLISQNNIKEIEDSNFRYSNLIAEKYSKIVEKNFLSKNAESISFDLKNESEKSILNISSKENQWDTFYNKSFFNILNNYVLLGKRIFNFPFISFNSIFEEDIYQLYNDLKTKRDKENLINTIQVVDSNIIDVELRQNFDDLESVFLLSFKNKDEFVPLNYLGDGFKRIFYIILKVLSLRGKRIMIDEIETGIHYSRQKDFLKNVLLVCKELDIQLFSTTHSEECIKAFYEASIELEQEENIRLISLEEGKNEKIYATTNRFENIKAGLISNVEFRK